MTTLLLKVMVSALLLTAVFGISSIMAPFEYEKWLHRAAACTGGLVVASLIAMIWVSI